VGGSTIIETGRYRLGVDHGLGGGHEQSISRRYGDIRYESVEPGGGRPAAVERRRQAGDSLPGGKRLSLGVALANPSATQSASLTEVIAARHGTTSWPAAL